MNKPPGTNLDSCEERESIWFWNISSASITCAAPRFLWQINLRITQLPLYIKKNEIQWLSNQKFGSKKQEQKIQIRRL